MFAINVTWITSLELLGQTRSWSRENVPPSARGASKKHGHSPPATSTWAQPRAAWSDAPCPQPPPPAKEFQGSDWTPQIHLGPQWRLLQWHQWHRCCRHQVPYDSKCLNTYLFCDAFWLASFEKSEKLEYSLTHVSLRNLPFEEL